MSQNKKNGWKKITTKISHPDLRNAIAPVLEELFGKNKNDIAPIWNAIANKVDKLYETRARRFTGEIRDMAWICILDDFLLAQEKLNLETKVVYKDVETTYGDLILTKEFVEVFKEMLVATRRHRNWSALFCTKIHAHQVQFYPEGDEYKNPDVVLQLWFEPQEDDNQEEIPLDNKDEYPDLSFSSVKRGRQRTTTQQEVQNDPVQELVEPMEKLTIQEPVEKVAIQTSVQEEKVAIQVQEPVVEKISVVHTSGFIVKDLKIFQGALCKVMYAVTQGDLTNAEKKEINDATNSSIKILEAMRSMTEVTTKSETTTGRMSAFANFAQQEPIGNWADA